MPLQIGLPLPTYTLYIRRAGKHGAIITWTREDGSPAVNLNGATLRMIIGERSAPVREFDAVVSNAVSTFHFTQEETDLPFDLYDGLIVLDDAGDLTPMVDLRVVVQPS